MDPAPREASCHLFQQNIIPRPHVIPSPSSSRNRDWLRRPEKTRQQQQERLKTKYNTALLPPSIFSSSSSSSSFIGSSYFILCLSLLSRQLWLINICRGSNLYLRKHKTRQVNACVLRAANNIGEIAHQEQKQN